MPALQRTAVSAIARIALLPWLRSEPIETGSYDLRVILGVLDSRGKDLLHRLLRDCLKADPQHGRASFADFED